MKKVMLIFALVVSTLTTFAQQDGYTIAENVEGWGSDPRSHTRPYKFENTYNSGSYVVVTIHFEELVRLPDGTTAIQPYDVPAFMSANNTLPTTGGWLDTGKRIHEGSKVNVTFYKNVILGYDAAGGPIHHFITGIL